MKKPLISKELIEYLEHTFRDRAPTLLDTDREVWATVGQVAVVKHLRKLYDDQSKNILST